MKESIAWLASGNVAVLGLPLPLRARLLLAAGGTFSYVLMSVTVDTITRIFEVTPPVFLARLGVDPWVFTIANERIDA